MSRGEVYGGLAFTFLSPARIAQVSYFHAAKKRSGRNTENNGSLAGYTTRLPSARGLRRLSYTAELPSARGLSKPGATYLSNSGPTNPLSFKQIARVDKVLSKVRLWAPFSFFVQIF